MSLSRRDVLKAHAAAVAAAAANISVPAVAQPVAGGIGALEIKWSKAPCRFCGTGCGVMVGVKEGKVVATHGDTLAEVNRGLNCIKGYFLSKIMYGGDRLTTPLLRKKNGVFDKNGEFTPVSWDEAFDVMAARAKQTLKEKGPTAVGMFGSGQWTMWEGYAATKLMRAGFRSNNLDPNARHCMASAAYAFMRTFGMDEPMGCYDDFEAADAFVLWGSNMAEMHPILWTRLTDRRLSHPHVKVAVLSTFTNRSSDLADIPIVFKPGTDLAILNYIANHIISTGRVNQDFVKNHTSFVKGTTDIGYGLRPDHPLEKKAKGAANAAATQPIDFDAYAKFVKEYTLEKASEISGVERGFLQELAELYADPKRKVMSLWTMGFNQHVRGVWANQLVYNLHLLTGKISEPGNSPFSLTGQPSACGTAREVGTFAHRLPADMTVTNPEHRKHAEEIWRVPHGLIPEKPGYHAVEQDRMLHDGKLNFYWVMVNNNLQAAPNNSRETYPGYRNPDNFIVVSDAYPTVTAMAADLILPAAMWVEKEGAYGNAERRTHFWRQLVNAPGRSALRPLAAHGVLQALHHRRGVAGRNARGKSELSRQDAVRRAVPQRQCRQVPGHRNSGAVREPRIQSLRLLRAERPVRGIRRIRTRTRSRSGAVRHLSREPRPALAGRQRQGDEVALSRGARPLRQARQGRRVLRQRRRPSQDHRGALRAAGGIA